MSEKYEQIELDTRPLLQAAIEDLTQSAITNTGQLIKEHHRQVAQGTMTAPPYVRNAIDATSSIVNSTVHATYVLLVAAAEMRRTLDNLYTVENTGRDETTPLEELAEAAFQEAEPADAGEHEMEE